MKHLIIGLITLAILLAANANMVSAQPHGPEMRQEAKQIHGPIDHKTSAIIREIINTQSWQRPTSIDQSYLSSFYNISTPATLAGNGLGEGSIQFDFATGDDWINRPRQCELLIYAYSPAAATEAFTVRSATYYTPVFGNEYWSYQIENFWEGRYWILRLTGPALEGAQDHEAWIRWWIDVAHVWLFGPYVKTHATYWRTIAYCEEEEMGDPFFDWHTWIVKIGSHGQEHWEYQYLPYSYVK